MEEIVVKTDKKNLDCILDYVNGILLNYDISMKSKFQLEMAIEEIFVNIVNYAYGDEIGDVKVQCFIEKNPLTINVKFIDQGIKFNPLEKDSPDTSVNVEDMAIGGLGIFLVRKNVDDILYKYIDNQNILTIKKKF